MQDFLEDFRQTIEAGTERLLQLSEQESQNARQQGKWSPREIVGHLIDSAANNHQRFVRAQFTEELIFPGYEQAEWNRVQGYADESWELLVQLWKHYNLHEIAWQTVAVDQPVTLEYFMRDYVGHLKHHLRQILGESLFQTNTQEIHEITLNYTKAI